ncbi:MAG: hypothetical protein JO110_06055 [Acetobacteraceae bacterium]|nr:hypothetical protein [Acetobacteraceae bacterium]MBV8458474.1 hypothetical protein [Acetobacteraceae bacterium]
MSCLGTDDQGRDLSAPAAIGPLEKFSNPARESLGGDLIRLYGFVEKRAYVLRYIPRGL